MRRSGLTRITPERRRSRPAMAETTRVMGYRRERPGATSGSGKFTKPPARHSRVGQARAFRDALTLARRPQAHRPQSSTKYTGGRWPNERKQPSDAFVAAGGVPATERRP